MQALEAKLEQQVEALRAEHEQDAAARQHRAVAATQEHVLAARQQAEALLAESQRRAAAEVSRLQQVRTPCSPRLQAVRDHRCCNEWLLRQSNECVATYRQTRSWWRQQSDSKSSMTASPRTSTSCATRTRACATPRRRSARCLPCCRGAELLPPHAGLRGLKRHAAQAEAAVAQLQEDAAAREQQVVAEREALTQAHAGRESAERQRDEAAALLRQRGHEAEALGAQLQAAEDARNEAACELAAAREALDNFEAQRCGHAAEGHGVCLDVAPTQAQTISSAHHTQRIISTRCAGRRAWM